MSAGRKVAAALAMTVDTGTTGKIDAVGDIALVDVSELEKIALFINQEVDNGTVTLLVEEAIDGTNWALLATVTEADFPAGANTAKKVTLSDSNGMPLVTRQVRVRCTVYTGTGKYSANYIGVERR